MDNLEQLLKREEIIQRRIDMDLLSRSMPGIFIYAVLWPVLFFPIGFHIQEPLLCWGLAGIQFFVSVARLTQARLTPVWYGRGSQSWRVYFAACSLTQAAVWGYLFFLAVGDPRMESMSFTLVLAVGGLSAGAIIALNARLWIGLTNISFVLLPGMAAAFLIRDFSLALMIGIYFFYLLMIGVRSHKEYRRAFKIESQLEAQRSELEKLNKIDPLTMIYNRGHFNATLEFQWNNGIRTHQPQSLLLIDVDHFKAINDEKGHLFGDECLVYIANSIHSTAKRSTDLIARFGGEEFAVLLSNTTLNEATMLAESIRREFEDSPFVYEGDSLNVTVSVGVSSMIPTPDKKPNLIIEQADFALYQAKNDGRNCVRVFDPFSQAKKL